MQMNPGWLLLLLLHLPIPNRDKLFRVFGLRFLLLHFFALIRCWCWWRWCASGFGGAAMVMIVDINIAGSSTRKSSRIQMNPGWLLLLLLHLPIPNRDKLFHVLGFDFFFCISLRSLSATSNNNSSKQQQLQVQ